MLDIVCQFVRPHYQHSPGNVEYFEWGYMNSIAVDTNAVFCWENYILKFALVAVFLDCVQDQDTSDYNCSMYDVSIILDLQCEIECRTVLISRYIFFCIQLKIEQNTIPRWASTFSAQHATDSKIFFDDFSFHS